MARLCRETEQNQQLQSLGVVTFQFGKLMLYH
jgi:hypothetical protein